MSSRASGVNGTCMSGVTLTGGVGVVGTFSLTWGTTSVCGGDFDGDGVFTGEKRQYEGLEAAEGERFFLMYGAYPEGVVVGISLGELGSIFLKLVIISSRRS